MKAIALLLVLVFLLLMALGEESPGSDNSYQQEVTAREILEKLSSGQPAIYSEKIIIGDLDVDDICLENNSRIVKSMIEIKDSEIRGRLNFADLLFYEPVNFDGTSFREVADFDNANFSQSASFHKSQFEKDAKFQSAQFLGEAGFKEAVFNNHAIFTESNFRGNADFSNSKINEGKFSNAIFEDWGIFTEAEFRNTAWLDYISFNSSALFDYSNFLQKSFFTETTFAGSKNKNFAYSTRFSEARFNDDASFNNAKFIRDVTFQDSRFLEEADFEKAKFLDKVDFNKTSFRGDASFWDTQFLQSVSLQGSKFSRLIVRWDRLSGHLIFGEVLYLSLIDNFRKLGLTGDANECYYELMIKKTKDPGIWPRSVDFVKWISCGYGVRPIRTVIVCAGVILFFGSLFCMGRGIDRPNSAKSQESLQSNPDEHSTKISGFWKWTRSVYFFRCYYYSTTVFIGGKSDIFALGDYKYLATIERIFGWLFFGLFLATLTRTLLG